MAKNWGGSIALGNHLQLAENYCAPYLLYDGFRMPETYQSGVRGASRQTLVPCHQEEASLLNSGINNTQNAYRLHQPGIEPRANAWKAFMLLLHHWCFAPVPRLLPYKNLTNQFHTVECMWVTKKKIDKHFHSCV